VVSLAGGEFTTLGGINNAFPQGRNVSQFGLVEDFSLPAGRNTFKLGANYKVNLVNDYDFGIGTTPLITTSLTSFFNGLSDAYAQSFPSRLNQPIRLYTLGAYAEDDIKATPGLTLTLALRAEHDSNPICTHFCIARMISPFTELNHNAAVPYNQVIQSGLAQAYPSYRHILFQPRFGFAWTPFASQHTVLRGGFGIFNDIFPALVVDSFAENSPLYNTFVVSGAGLAPTAAGSGFTAASADNTAFLNGFNSGGTLASITAGTPAFTPPNFFTSDRTIRPPRYQEWNLEIQQAIGRNQSFSINYVGNHGVHETIQNEGFNAFAAPAPGYAGLTGLPTAAPDPRFGVVTQLVTGGSSNYNGLTVSYQQRLSHSLQFQANYTWSHALDWLSNGGLLPFSLGTDPSLTGVQDPYNIRKFNYGNADYDIRHYFSMSYLWQVPFSSAFHWGPNQLWQGWTVSGTLFTRSGLPLTVLDGNATTSLLGSNNGPNDVVFANQIGVPQTSTCTISKATCLNAAAFSSSTSLPTAFGNQTRNQFRGPHFFDTDLSLIKNTQIPGWEKGTLGVGVQFFNLFNHPNFDKPVGDIANSQFGNIRKTVSVPTSILGSFLGGDASPRVIQLTAKLTF
ncbi:MAG: TonB-dependent receptor domain-containing protein, partial [Terriglobales bacterium]